MSWGYVAGAAVSVGAGMLGGDDDEASSRPQVPAWLQDKQIDLANRTDQMLSRPSLTPEQRIAELDPAQNSAIQQMMGYGEEGGTGATLLDRVLSGSGGVEGGMAGLQDVLGSEGPQNQGIDMDYVGSLINNDILGGQVDAASRDVVRQFSEVDAPQSRMMQALSGGTGSTRGAIGDAILQRGAEDRVGDISSTMRGNAFSQALGLGGQRSSQNASLDSMTRGQDITASGQMLRGGLDSATMANEFGMNNIDMLMSGGGMNRAFEQSMRDIEYQNWQRMYGDLDQASEIYGGLGSQYTGANITQSNNPNYGELALSGAGALGAGFNDVFDSWGGGSNDDAFDFTEGGFYNPQFDS